jgi:hypothetical protein
VGGMEAAAGMVVAGTAAASTEDGTAAGMEDGGVAGVVGTAAVGMEGVGGPDMATAGMVLVILIGAGTAAVGGPGWRGGYWGGGWRGGFHGGWHGGHRR